MKWKEIKRTHSTAEGEREREGSRGRERGRE
jgi:hypothetical protein